MRSEKYAYLDGYDLAGVLGNAAVKREYALGELNVVCGHRAYDKQLNIPKEIVPMAEELSRSGGISRAESSVGEEFLLKRVP